MDTKVSAKGHVALPTSLRQRLGIKPGDELHAEVQGEGILLSPKSKPQRKKKYKTWVTTDPITGMAVLAAEKGAPELTNEIVREMLADFP
jgi:AbrB family looped-hinge helix DNA binding protein